MDNSTYRADLRGPGIVNTVGNAELSSISPGSEASQPKLRVVIDLKWNEPLDVVLPQNIRRNGLTYQESATILNATLGISLAGRGQFANLAGFGLLTKQYGTGVEVSGLLDSNLLDWIEGYRNGGSVTLACNLHCVVFRSGSVLDAEGRILGAASVIDSAFANWQSIEVAASTWIDEFLPQFGYSGPRYIELPTLSGQDYGRSAAQHLHSALSALQQGQFRAVPMHCLASLDAIAKSYHYDSFATIHDPREWLGGATDERKKVLSSFRNYLNRWRHDNTAKGAVVETMPPLVYEEATFVYVTALFLARLMGKHLPQNPDR